MWVVKLEATLFPVTTQSLFAGDGARISVEAEDRDWILIEGFEV